MTSRSQLDSDYGLLSQLANVAEAGSLSKDRAVLLLWFFRNVVGVDDLEAYEYVCDGDDDQGIDGLFLEPGPGDADYETLVVYQSKYTQGPTNVGRNSLQGLVSAANHFMDIDSLQALLDRNIEDQLRQLIKRFDLVSKLEADAYREGRLRVRIVFVTSGVLNGQASALISATNRAHTPGFFSAFDLRRLGPLALATTTQKIPEQTVVAPCDEGDRLVIGNAPGRIAVAAIVASDLVRWGGIDDRTLFELNVRRELRPNKVSRQLDAAIERGQDHANFLAYHNGITVVCESFRVKKSGLEIRNPAVVNGAQSVVAFNRGFEKALLSDALRIFVKVIEVAERQQLAREISRRSNTQNPVNPRNLASLTGPQPRLKAEFEERFPDVLYQISPDASLAKSEERREIQNDLAAQLLCSVYNSRPWLAVKRMSLFESENHAMIFPESIHAEHIMLVDLIGEAVAELRTTFPETYRRSWQLTQNTVVYLVGQLLRAVDDGSFLANILDQAQRATENQERFVQELEPLVASAAATLELRRDRLQREGRPDDFKVDFKREDALRELADQARDNYVFEKAKARATRARKG
jgi:hypothetical protein